MSVLGQFWLSMLETIYMPIYTFIGYNPLLTFIIIALFVILQIWIFWHLFLKPFIYILKIFVSFVFKHNLWRDYESNK